jgi:hypothetical protein
MQGVQTRRSRHLPPADLRFCLNLLIGRVTGPFALTMNDPAALYEGYIQVAARAKPFHHQKAC